MKKSVKIVILLLVFIFLGSTGYLVIYNVDLMIEQKRLEELDSKLENQQKKDYDTAEKQKGSTKEENSKYNNKQKTHEEVNQEKVENEEEKEIMPKFSELYKENNDLVGWIKIEDTKIDYPVMQSSDDDPEFYLHNGWNKEESITGIPFLDSRCDINESENLFIYGHRMKNGDMFGNLKYYKEKNFFDEHQNIEFSSLYEDANYQVIGVFVAKGSYTDDENAFLYYNYIELDEKEQFDEYYNFVKLSSIYETGNEASFGDKLITLCTCDYDLENGRLLVVAKKI